ncbi:unnamed protein product [Phytomonas sp. Hart1]|nr:unnamed protein product [Phytomonas sp. Hart1]|eukprot:CCW69214.1 unnamed protein product [Phytomonas sp. isolate Hart1]
MLSSCASINQGKPHYIAEDVYTLGTLSCAVCGQAFPINSCARMSMSCGACGTLHQAAETAGSHASSTTLSSTSALYAAARLFTQDAVDAVMRWMEASQEEDASGTTAAGASTQGKPRVGTTEVDNRVIEEALCETCGVHRPCKSFARQTRGADEGQTIFYQCTVCKSEWQQNS